MTRRTPRADLTGLQPDRGGWRAWVWVHGRNVSRRFPADTHPATMQAWRAAVRAQAVDTRPPAAAARTGLAADVARYLRIVARLPTIDTRQQHLEDWVTALGARRDRRTVSPAEVAEHLARWQRDRQYAASTLNHRRHALAHLYRTLDPGAPNPARAVPRFREPQPEPRGLPTPVVQAILDALRARSVIGRGSVPSRTAAHLRVLATTGLPPATIGRLTPAHLEDLNTGVVLVPGRLKGKGTLTARHAVMPAGVAALRHFAAIDAWGPVPSSTRLIVWRRAVRRVRQWHPTWVIPADVRPYDLRHSLAELAYRATHDLALVQDIMGHKDQRATRRYAAGAIPEGEAAAIAKVATLWEAAVRDAPRRRQVTRASRGR